MDTMRPEASRTLLPGLLTLLLLTGTADAHSVGGEARLRDGKVQVEGYFEDDTAATGAKVHVEDAAGKPVAEGRLDDKGRWSFPAPAPGRYRVIIDAGGGHRTRLSVRIPASASPPAPSREAPGEEAPVVSEGATREEHTHVPWGRLGIGLALIAVLAVAVPRVLRAARKSPAPDPSAEGK